MMRGRRDEPNLNYPDLGAVLARELGQADSQVPDYVSFYFATEGRDIAPGTAGFLGCALCPDGAVQEHDAREHPPPRRHHRPRPQGTGRPARPAQQAVRPRPGFVDASTATTRPTSASAA